MNLKRETIKALAENNFKNGLYCAESVVLSITRSHGIESELLPKMATAFCSGMSRTCGTCGALTGAVMGISAVLGRNSVDESVEDAYKATLLIVQKFEHEFGARDCHALLGCDLATSEGQNTFREEMLHERCRSYTSKAAEFAEEILSDFRNIEIIPISDIEEIILLLNECHLPTDDIASNPKIECYGIKRAENLIGLVGLEVMGDVALLRSLAVTPAGRNSGIGKLLVKFAESTVVSKRVSQVYLLTTTAQHYFEKLGYKTIDRSLSPEQIKKTGQFSTICPSTAIFMVKKIVS